MAKTEAALSLISWYHARQLKPVLLDFDIENANKSGLQNFYPEAIKLDVHREGSLDEFFEVCDHEDVNLVVADLGAGAGAATYAWFDQAYEDAQEFDIDFTAIGVTTNDAGAVQSVLKWADHLQDRVNYLVVLNEMREPDSDFEYWHDEPAVQQFIDILKPEIMTMGARIQEFQAELRNQSATLEQVSARKVEVPFLQKTKNVVRAKRYQRNLFKGFDRASAYLLP